MKEKQASSLERAFLARWDQLTRDLDPKPPDPVFQCRFHPEREWVYDFSWINQLVCIDLQGGGWINGGHSRELGMANDFAKHNAALVLGWRPFLASASMIENDPAAVILPIVALLKLPVLSPNAEYSIWLSLILNLTHVEDVVSNNGITVKRMKSNRFLVEAGKNEYRMGDDKLLITAQRQVLDFILHGMRPTATSAALVRPSYLGERTYF